MQRPEVLQRLENDQVEGTNLDPRLGLEDVRRLDEVYSETQTSSNLTSYALRDG